MIPATEALALPTAQLSEDEQVAAAKLENDVEEHIRKAMKWQGCVYRTTENNEAVVIEVIRRLKAMGYSPQWQPIVEQHRLNMAKQTLVGFQIVIIPSDEAYQTAVRSLLS